MNLLMLLGGVRASIFAGLAALLLAVAALQTMRLNSLEASVEKERAAAVVAQLNYANELLALERKYAADYAAVAEALIEENERAKVDVDKLVAGLRSGTERLRSRFQCPSAVPGTSPASSGGDEAAEGGLRGEDAEFLVREAERADTIVRQLTSCQQLLENFDG